MGNTTETGYLDGINPSPFKGKHAGDNPVKDFDKGSKDIDKGINQGVKDVTNWGKETWKAVQDLPGEIESAFFKGVAETEDKLADGLTDFGQLELETADVIVKADDVIISEVLPQLFEMSYATIKALLPELLSLPANIVLFFSSVFMTVAGLAYLDKTTAQTRANAPLQNIPPHPALLHPDLDPDDVVNVINSVLG